MIFSRPLIALSSLAPLAFAAPLEVLIPRDVFSPQILSPNAATIWQSGAIETVTWNTTGAPSSISNYASVILKKGYNYVDTLAQGFDLRAGEVDVTVPSGLATGNNYSIILMGDSGNVSPQFEVVGE
ncbi:hypothetical protein PENSPDRAFT_665726 [Peniophora sp. CONT]|nr:hypothetical protein PENSPDRAFT_665726 [Peniophora sp. CONT]